MAETPEKEWQALRPSADEGMDAAVQQWAEVDYVPNWTAYSKKDPHYRFLAVREPMHKPPLPGMEVESDRASRFVNMHESDWYKVSGVVTNRTIAGEELTRIPHLAQTSDAVNRQLSCFSSRYMNLLAVFQI